MFRHHASMATLLFSILAFAGCAEEEPGLQQHFPSDAAIQALIQSRVDEKRAVGIRNRFNHQGLHGYPARRHGRERRGGF